MSNEFELRKENNPHLSIFLLCMFFIYLLRASILHVFNDLLLGVTSVQELQMKKSLLANSGAFTEMSIIVHGKIKLIK